ncbi:MAG: ABC transporter permease, partial [Spirochaetota bacterium]
MYILHIAFKNILREKRRTILTFMMFSFGIASYIIMAGMLEGTDRMSIKNLIEHETGHMMVRSSDYSDDHPYDEEGMLDGSLAQETIAFLETKQFVTGIAPRLEFLAELDNAKDALAVTAVGVDPDRDRTVFDFSQAIRSGDLQSGSCVIGRELAGDLNVKTGDIVYLTFKNRNGMYTSIDLEIVEEIVTTNPAIHASTVYLSINEAREMLAS